ncbi:hypothetical protein [Dyella japonica]|uniref:DUF2946 domain-containing protein n=1 Tax=Dyella japonica DSM 16301 TaxID=1440762 RepID=A0A0G9H225_9GAMM|nr:hypothetical protein [Dyella japonica]KLD63895.1 hypothetical protein Y882_09755 [Dyella japonica DSM 16301]
MSPRPLPLLHRLRRHRGLWALVVAVLLIKLVSGSVCLADGGGRAAGAGLGDAATSVTMVVAAPAPSGDGDCLLGEGASCHCACPHAAGLPTSVALAVDAPDAPFLVSSVDAGRVPAIAGSLLRPPIA